MTTLLNSLNSRTPVPLFDYADTQNEPGARQLFTVNGADNQSPITVIIPAYNEEMGMRAQVVAIESALQAHGLIYELIVVDDGSMDRTAAEALQTGVRVLQHQVNRGYGAAIKTGITAARYNTIVIIDADGTYPADQIPALVAKAATADMVVGARIGNDVHIPWVRRPAKWLLSRLAVRIADQPIPDLNSGLRAFHRDCIEQYFPILSNRFSFTTTSTLALLADDYRVVYHPINYYERVGRSKITPRHFIDFIILILRMAMLFQPLKIFVPLALTLGSLGVLKVIYDVIALFLRYTSLDLSLLYQPTISASATLLLLVGFQLLLIGMMADGVVRRIGQHNRHQVPSRAVRGVELHSQLGDEAGAFRRPVF